MADSNEMTRKIDLGNNLGDIVVKANGAVIRISSSGNIHILVAPTNEYADTTTTRAIGSVESIGEHKGEIYAGVPPGDQKPIWISPAPRLMNHFDAAAWTKEQGGALPTRKQADYLDAIKDQGALQTIFNTGSSYPDGLFWLSEPSTRLYNNAWFQRFGNGEQGDNLGMWSSSINSLCVRS